MSQQEYSPSDEEFGEPDLELSDYLMFDDHQYWVQNDDHQTNMASGFGSSSFPNPHLYQPISSQPLPQVSATHPPGPISSSSRNNKRSQEKNKDVKERYAFKVESEMEIMDDGFKWRKYGKKMVKNSPNPRNYYRCSVESCPVKKRVERDREDPRYVITTYEGTHNHHTFA